MIEELAKRYNLPEILVYALILQNVDDHERLETLKIKLQPYKIWNFANCSDLFGDDYPGRIPGQLIAHVLYCKNLLDK